MNARFLREKDLKTASSLLSSKHSATYKALAWTAPIDVASGAWMYHKDKQKGKTHPAVRGAFDGLEMFGLDMGAQSMGLY